MTFTSGIGNLLQMNNARFDFDIQFEQVFFSILPSAIFIPVFLWRSLSQARKPAVVNAPAFLFLKSVTLIIYVSLELALLVLATIGSLQVTSLSIASSVLRVLSALLILVLSVLEHSRSPRPPIILNGYLFLTLILEIAQTRTLFMSSDDEPELTYSIIMCVSMALKVAVLLLEAYEKRRWVDWDDKMHSPEETSGIFSLGIYFWLNKMFMAGYRNVLAVEDLYPLDSSFDAQALHKKFADNMDYFKLKGDRFGLLKILARTLKAPLLLPITPRLALVGFTFCQPLFIERLLIVLSGSEIDANVGYGLIGASILIYSGIAISYALSWYFHHRFRTMVRSILVTETFAAATRAQTGSSDDSAALTLMSTDMERINMGLFYVHETWASIFQAALASWMLYERLRVVFLAPMGVIFACFFGLGILIHFTGDSQRSWMSGIQKRVGLTATVIASMKSVKISGLTTAVGDYIQQLRVDELAAGARFRQIFMIAAAFAFMSQLINPPVTFAITSRKLDSTTIFTSLSFLNLLTSPLLQLFQSIPDIVSGLACLGRIQTFLEHEPRHDFRQVFDHLRQDQEKIPADLEVLIDSRSEMCIIIKDANLGWKAGKFVLKNVSAQIPTSSLTMVIGPVGSDDVFSGLDADTETKVFQRVFGADGLLRKRKSTVVLCTHNIRHLPAADQIIALEDGLVVQQGTFDDLSSREGYIQRLKLNGGSDRESMRKESVPPTRSEVEASKSELAQLPTASDMIASSLAPEQISARQTGDGSVFKHYLKNMGWFVVACSLFFGTLWGVFTNFPSIWLSFWSDSVASAHPDHSKGYYVGVYAVLQICAMIALFLLGTTILIVSVKRAGANLHQSIPTTLIQAPLSFFTNTDTGIVTNLFSQDLNLIDTELPDALLNTQFCVFQSIGQAAVMLTSSAYLAISYPLLGGFLFLVQRFYMRTSRQLRLLDLETKSPLYAHFLDIVRGIVTLRAFGFLPDDLQKNAQLVNSSQRPAYLLPMIQEWLNLVLNITVMVIAVVMTSLAVRLHSSTAFAGASLYSLMSFGDSLSGTVIFYTKLETSIGAISRLKSFNETVIPEDREYEDIIPGEEWSQRGTVELKGVSAKYNTTGDNFALNNVNLSIQAGERIAICGRSGSGKSSLIALLLKLLDPLPATSNEETKIPIDDTPLHLINRIVLRERLVAVPQDPVFLPDGSTFGRNLDPSLTCTSKECTAALEVLGLRSFIQELGGLEAPMNAGTFSAGQRQLFSLARALLRRTTRAKLSNDENSGGILLLDEASSSVDQETELVMQDTVRSEFKGFTVIAVAHRLEMIMDFDRVVVIDTGKIVEIGNPEVLRGLAGSRFGELVNAGAN
ncbi:ABC multidrug transporter [Penicillium psychrosexuale]|uniref:ABC multidrug transporter n=1 Tax=Penicillium psychrosexuale TaxID=1002107 RepID=UPI002545B5CD|nr:ABC multidrug transporter [Penicillium psychrosexuale]KAJ5783587.1 ABC multidrug transporter [Penicillium psychrosexuale]